MSFTPTVTISLEEYKDLKKKEAEFLNRDYIKDLLKKSLQFTDPYIKFERTEARILYKQIDEVLNLDIWK